VKKNPVTDGRDPKKGGGISSRGGGKQCPSNKKKKKGKVRKTNPQTPVKKVPPPKNSRPEGGGTTPSLGGRASGPDSFQEILRHAKGGKGHLTRGPARRGASQEAETDTKEGIDSAREGKVLPGGRVINIIL